MKDRRIIIIIGAVGIVAVIGCCLLVVSGTLLTRFSARLLSSAPATPQRHGVYLKEGRSLVELAHIRGGPNPGETAGIPSTSSSRPTLVVWVPAVNLAYLQLYRVSPRWTGEFTTSPSGEMIEITPRTELSPGLYCLMQGDPLRPGATLSHWCFQVE